MVLRCSFLLKEFRQRCELVHVMQTPIGKQSPRFSGMGAPSPSTMSDANHPPFDSSGPSKVGFDLRQPHSNARSIVPVCFVGLACVLLGVLSLGTVWGAPFPIFPVWVNSVHPFCQGQDRVQEPGLLGSWREVKAGGQAQLQFEPLGTNGYRVTVADGESTNRMQGHCLKLGGALFVELFAAATEPGLPLPPPPIPSHLLLRVRQVDPTLRLSAIKNDWAAGFLKETPAAFHHAIIQGDRVVLTGDTAELRKFVLQSLDDTAAWEDLSELGREPASGGKQDAPASTPAPPAKAAAKITP